MTVNMVSVFCGSSYGKDKQIKKDIKELGRLLGDKASLVLYGGGLYGHLQDLMDGVGETGGNMQAIISPAYFDPKELYPPHVNVIRAKDDEGRIQKFLDADAFIVTPGGDGTFAEAMLSHNRNISALFQKEAGKPVVFMNTNNFYKHIKNHFKHMVTAGYSNNQRQQHLHFEPSPKKVVQKIFL
jgi:uncharacterized protein (TIGR00730 family)